MSLADELNHLTANPGPDRTQCTIGLILKAVDPATGAALLAALANPLVYATKIADALNNDGHRTNQKAVQAHRKGQCRCPKVERR